jgi:hypothetical protein
MSLEFFPVEIIEKIVKIIERDNDLNTLYYLCLTNRIFCQITIPYLWKKPLYIEKFKGNYLVTTPVISILLYFIKNTNIKSFLKRNFRYFFYIPSNPLFNYASFIKQIDFAVFFKLVENWLTTNKEFCRNSHRYREDGWEYIKNCCGKTVYFTNSGLTITLIEIIFRMIVKNIDGFEVINFDYEYDIPDDFYEVLFRLEDSQKCLKNLRKIMIREGALFYQIMHYTLNLKRIYIEITNDPCNFMKSLLSQRNLKEVDISMNYINYQNCLNNLDGMMSPLLEALQICDCDISDNLLQFFINCNRLKKLKMFDVFFTSQNKILERIIFPDLEELVITLFSFKSKFEKNNFKQFFTHHLKNLKILEVYQFEEDSNSGGLNIPLLLSENDCSNITYLSLQIYDISQFSNIIIMLKNSKNLEELELTNSNNGMVILNDQLLNDVSLSCNKNLKVLNIIEWEISISGLKILLTQKNLFLKKLYCFIRNGNSYNVERLIRKYKVFNNRRIINYTRKDPRKDCYGKVEYYKSYLVVVEWA